MKRARKVILWILGLVSLLMLILAGTVYWIFEHPKETYAFVEQHFFPEDLSITWNTMNFEGKKLGGLNFEVDWQFEGLSIQKKKPLIDFPIQFVHLKAGVFPKSTPKVLIHELNLKVPDTLRFRAEPSQKKKQVQNPFQSAQTIFDSVAAFKKWVKIENLNAELKRFELLLEADKKMAVAVQLKQSSDSQDPENIQMQIQTEIPSEQPLKLQLEGNLNLEKFQTEQVFLDSQIQFSGFGAEITQKMTLAHSDQTTWMKSQGPVDYRAQKMHLIFHPELALKLDPNQAETKLFGDVAGIPGPLVKVDNFKAEMITPMDQNVLWSEKPSQFSLSAPVALFFIDASMRKPLEDNCKCKIPEVLLTKVGGKAWLSNLLSQSSEKKPVLDADINIESVHNRLLSADIAASIKMEKQNKDFYYSPSLNGSIEIHSYQGFRRFLDAKNVLIPAPFDVMEGALLFTSRGPVETSETGYVFPANLNVELTSSNQKISVKTEAQAHLNNKLTEAQIEIKARISDFQVELPPLDPMKGKPRVTLDQRILRAPKIEKAYSKFKFSMSFEVETARPGAIRLLSKYFDPYLPLSLQIKRSSDKNNTGFIQTEPFQIVYLRRKVKVEKMRLDLTQAEKGIFPVDAQFKIQQTQYLITIDVKGTTAEPHITMSSDPYLPESEIISVLLYDRTSDQLISADAETAGGVQAAMADRAIGLFGLWAFAATPIKSFSYNPVTKVYTATVALADDVTAGIGTNWEAATHLELRKRVSRKWMLTAAWTQATPEEAQNTRLVLQWEQRF
jgi:hypothetical protein